jgi:hypothetical protein
MKPTKTQRRLRTIYYTPTHPLGFSGNLKRLTNVSKQADKWLDQQDVWSLHRTARKRYRRNRILVFGKFHIWSVDLMDMQQLKRENDNYAYILVVIDVFSKQVDLAPLKNKKPSTVIEAFQHILDSSPVFGGFKPAFVRSDKGGEFSRLFTQFLNERGIKHYYAMNDVKASVVERVIRTLRRKMYRYFTYKKSRRYLEVLPKLVHSYNRSYHSSIGMQPIQVTFENQDKVRENLFGTSDIAKLMKEGGNQLAQNRKLRKSNRQFKPGDYVRISKHTTIFDKGYLPNYTSEVFRILKREPESDIKGRRPMYTLIDLNGEQIIGSRFYGDELSKAK